MNIKHTELADALVLTTSDPKIISCARCCINDECCINGKGKVAAVLSYLQCVRLRN